MFLQFITLRKRGRGNKHNSHRRGGAIKYRPRTRISLIILSFPSHLQHTGKQPKTSKVVFTGTYRKHLLKTREKKIKKEKFKKKTYRGEKNEIEGRGS